MSRSESIYHNRHDRHHRKGASLTLSPTIIFQPWRLVSWGLKQLGFLHSAGDDSRPLGVGGGQYVLVDNIAVMFRLLI
jgi:hypothetical protein